MARVCQRHPETKIGQDRYLQDGELCIDTNSFSVSTGKFDHAPTLKPESTSGGALPSLQYRAWG